jgi:hypothetical protein
MQNTPLYGGLKATECGVKDPYLLASLALTRLVNSQLTTPLSVEPGQVTYSIY